MRKKLFKYLPALLLVACYSPEPYVASADDSSSKESAVSSEMGTVYPVNKLPPPKNQNAQICNPSVSQDPDKFPASMLWLNFSGDLGVKAPDSVYNVTDDKKNKVRVLQHDRLTISDTAENVLWYLMRDTANGDCQFQDPEWSTHPNFIASLRAYDVTGSKVCDVSNLDYGIIAIRISDKKRFVFYKKEESEYGDPHIWVDPSVTEVDTSASDTTISGFFGTDNVRLVFVRTKGDGDKKVREFVFRDFANGGKEVKLKLPKGYNGKSLENPVISPDGHFVVYNLVDGSNLEAYIQELSKDSNPIKIEKVDGMLNNPAMPRWFKLENRLFVVWAEFVSNLDLSSNRNDYTLTSVQDGSIGRTLMREIRLTAGTASDLTLEWVGDVREVSPVPMIGGRSPDGRYLATGTSYGFLVKLP